MAIFIFAISLHNYAYIDIHDEGHAKQASVLVHSTSTDISASQGVGAAAAELAGLFVPHLRHWPPSCTYGLQ